MKHSETFNTPDMTETFWQLVTEHHGEVKSFGLAQYYAMPAEGYAHIDEKKSRADIAKSKQLYWGIYYITAQGLFFYHFSQSSFFSNLLGQTSQSEFCVGFPFEQIESWRYIAPQKGFANIFKKQTQGLFVKAQAKKFTLLPTTVTGYTQTKKKQKSVQDVEDVFTCPFVHVLLLDLKEMHAIHTLENLVGNKQYGKA